MREKTIGIKYVWRYNMEVKKIFRNILLMTFLVVFMLFGTAFSVFAETEPTETYAIESFVPDTTEENTEPPVTEGADTTASDPTETDTVAETTAKPEPTYRESLPEISSEEIVIPSKIEEAQQEEGSLLWGFIAWVCVGVGVAVILAVLLTTKTKAIRSGGKKRYSTGDKISGKQRLLDDKYYNKRRK